MNPLEQAARGLTLATDVLPEHLDEYGDLKKAVYEDALGSAPRPALQAFRAILGAVAGDQPESGREFLEDAAQAAADHDLQDVLFALDLTAGAFLLAALDPKPLRAAGHEFELAEKHRVKLDMPFRARGFYLRAVMACYEQDRRDAQLEDALAALHGLARRLAPAGKATR